MLFLLLHLVIRVQRFSPTPLARFLLLYRPVCATLLLLFNLCATRLLCCPPESSQRTRGPHYCKWHGENIEASWPVLYCTTTLVGLRSG